MSKTTRFGPVTATFLVVSSMIGFGGPIAASAAAAGRVSSGGAPVVATALQASWALVLLWTASFEAMLLYAGVGLAIFSMLSVAAVSLATIAAVTPRPG